MTKGIGKYKNKIKAAVAACALAVSLIGVIPVQAAPSYDVEFRAGSKGEIDGKSKVTVRAEYGSSLLAAVRESGVNIQPDAEAGYWFTGWNPEFAETVVEKTVYVAQYARMIDEVEYRINYVDASGVSLATQQVAKASKGVEFTVYAEAIAGYAPDAASKRLTISESGTEVTFVYTTTLEPNVVTETVTETVTQNVPVTAPGTTTGGTAAGTVPGAGENPAGTAGEAEEPENIPDEEVPAGNIDANEDGSEGGDTVDREISSISDEEVPKSNKELSRTPGWVYGVLGGSLAVLAAIGVILVVLKRKRG